MMKIRYNRENQEQNVEIERNSPSEVDPLSNTEIPEFPPETHEDKDQLTNDEESTNFLYDEL